MSHDMKQVIKSGIVYEQPCKTRFEWVDETDDTGKVIYWLYVQTEGLDSDVHLFTTTSTRAERTLELCELHHRDSCWPDWFGPLPDVRQTIWLGHLTALSGYHKFTCASTTDWEE